MSDQRESRAERTARLLAEKNEARSADLIGDEPEGFEPIESNEPQDHGGGTSNVEEPRDEASERRKLLLQGIDPEIAALITDEELEEIHAEAARKARDAKRAAALKLIRAQADQNARADFGLIPASQLLSDAERKRQNELVRFRCEVPMNGGRIAGSGGTWAFRINGEEFQAGREYERPRHVFDSLREMHWRSHLNQVMFVDLNQDKVYQRGDDARGLTPAEILLGQRPPTFEVTKH